MSSSLVSPSLKSMLTTLHRYYPTARVLAEFVPSHQNQWVVRARVTLGDWDLSSAMATGPTIEAAEDAAKQRAIAMLMAQHHPQVSLPGELLTPQASPPLHSSPVQEDRPPYSALNLGDPAGGAIASPPATGASTLGSSTPLPATSSIGTAPPWSLDSEMVSEDEFDKSQFETYAANGVDDEAVQGQPEMYSPSSSATAEQPTGDGSPPSPARRPSKRKKRSGARSSQPPDTAGESPKMEEDESPSPVAEDAYPVDWSDIIAKTSVELKRLGWTDAQGRQHLQDTYGKRSRQQLTDEELLDFLNFLEAQPHAPSPF